jgi:hypothetical protein
MSQLPNPSPESPDPLPHEENVTSASEPPLETPVEIPPAVPDDAAPADPAPSTEDPQG